ncbi:hypothetical protein T191209_187 [Synechococcus phage S-CAM22]|uniref:Uncharacterized protein n=1 Tax=Synechococcus phage S-CAM22 TaxID=1883365 RepID=A0A1D8KRE0_9CAUD|nr:hypothetical protein BOW88_gp044 [Synechococcus phage S-CAM22]YP_010088848.1 hypothetical protein KNT15_gp044 [Synechococcus phage S-CAM22]AOV61019.1 hypothetical protein C350210_188 [Synechococcus phage S-CAM22]AOV61233.1 hypothetical protein N440310_187 [Synechococcus phage S-CAM22]AOV61447.1 hypothetical protein T191209_187 [Synechococcus phage S-CAM22]
MVFDWMTVAHKQEEFLRSLKQNGVVESILTLSVSCFSLRTSGVHVPQPGPITGPF